jgi:hypothetical protein
MGRPGAAVVAPLAAIACALLPVRAMAWGPAPTATQTQAQAQATPAAAAAESPAPPAPAPAAAPEPAPPPGDPAPAPAPTPAPAAPFSPAPPPPPAEPAPAPPQKLLAKDTLAEPGYVPGYRLVPSLGMSPYSPRVGALPGGLTAGFGAPMPPNEWTFQWSGFMNVTGQAGINTRPVTAEGQRSTVFHVPPQVVDDYQSFVGTATMPGNWIQMNFRYGNRDVVANLTLSTWNPSQPTTYYQLGSQGFVNNAYLTYNIPPIGKLRLRTNLGYFFFNYGNLGQYTAGMYQAPYVGGARGIGGLLVGEYPLNPEWSLTVEEGFMGNRNGRSPAGNAPANPNNNVDPSFPASYIQHLHVGLTRKTDYTLRVGLHWMWNFARDERVEVDINGNPLRDNMVTRGIDESNVPNGHIHVLGIDASMAHPTYGLLAVGASHIDARYAYPLRGLLTFGGEGQQLTERWLGVDTGGTGQVDVAAINYSASLGRIVSGDRPFDPNGPDVVLNAGAVIAVSRTPSMCGDAPTCFDNRVRHKFGVDGLYSFLPFMAAGLRVDRVVPNSKDSSETFHVAAARLVFKTDWQSRESIMLLYAKWFYGTNTHPEYSSVVVPRLDDQLIALNVNIWW